MYKRRQCEMKTNSLYEGYFTYGKCNIVYAGKQQQST